jgi:hypothetical protein
MKFETNAVKRNVCEGELKQRVIFSLRLAHWELDFIWQHFISFILAFVCECEWKKLEVIGGRKIFLFIE